MALNLTPNTEGIDMTLDPIDIMGEVRCVECSRGARMKVMNMSQALDHLVLIHRDSGDAVNEDDVNSVKGYAESHKTRKKKETKRLTAA